MTSKDRDVILHIIMHCDRVNEDIERFGNTLEAFENDRTFADSVSMNILQIGELSHNLSQEFRESTKQEIPWRKVYDMRNHFAHGYHQMDDKIIWNVATFDIPVLKAFCEKQIKQSEQNKN